MGKAARRKRERASQDRSELLRYVVEQGPPAEVVDPRPEEARTFDMLYSYSEKTPLWLSTPALRTPSYAWIDGGKWHTKLMVASQPDPKNIPPEVIAMSAKILGYRKKDS